MSVGVGSRAWYVMMAIITMVMGFSVHRSGSALPTTLKDVAGDALWAAMMFWGVSGIAPTRSMWSRGSVAFVICVVVECSQLVHAALLDQVRHTTLGHLVLGSDFDPRDVAAYFVGVAAAMLIERAARRGTTST